MSDKRQTAIGIGNRNTVNNTTIVSRESVASLLDKAKATLKDRPLKTEVKKSFDTALTGVMEWIDANQDAVKSFSKYSTYPFKDLALPETMENPVFIETLLETLALLKALDFNHAIVDGYMNSSINGKLNYGLFFNIHRHNLRISFVKLLQELINKEVLLDANSVFIINNCLSCGEALDKQNIDNVVTDILDNTSYIEPLKKGNPSCVALSAYMVENFETKKEAEAFISGVLAIGKI